MHTSDLQNCKPQYNDTPYCHIQSSTAFEMRPFDYGIELMLLTYPSSFRNSSQCNYDATIHKVCHTQCI